MLKFIPIDFRLFVKLHSLDLRNNKLLSLPKSIETSLAYQRPIILEIGSNTTRIGFAGEMKPTIFAPTLMGVPKYTSITTGSNFKVKDAYYGDEVLNLRGVLKLTYLVENNVNEHEGNTTILDMDQMMAFLDYYFDQMNINPVLHNLYVVAPWLNINYDELKSRLHQLYEFSGIESIMSPLTVIEAYDTDIGIVVDLTDTMTKFVPVVDRFLMKKAAKILDYGGRDITDYMRRLRHAAVGYRYICHMGSREII